MLCDTMIAFFLHACKFGFSSLTVFGFGYFAVKFPIIYFVVIIRNVIVSWICSWYVNYYSKTISTLLGLLSRLFYTYCI